MQPADPPRRTLKAADVADAKASARAEARQRRALLPEALRAADDARRVELLVELARELGARTAACYLSMPPEPETRTLVDALAAAGHKVLVPVLTKGELVNRRRRPAWATYAGRDDLRPGWHGIEEPSGAHVDETGLAEADLILTSALAGAPDGVRLGVGGGWYDRALRCARDDAKVVALLHRGELVDWLPATDLDVRVDAFALPDGLVWVKSTAQST